MTARLPRVDITRNDDRQWYWRFVASNGRELARSSETYKRRIDCVRCLDRVLGAVVPLPQLGRMDGADEAVLYRDPTTHDGISRPLLTVRVLR